MRNILIFFAVFLLLLEAPGVAAAEPAKLKHVVSLYTDNAEGPFKYPEGVACSTSSVLVADTGNNRIVRFSIQGQSFSADAVFPTPQAFPLVVQMNSKGEIYALDGKERRIIKLNSAGEPQGHLAPKNVPSPANIVPRSFRIDRKDKIYLLDIFSERVIVLSPDEQYEGQIAFPEGYGFFSDLTVTPQGVVYLLDSVRAVIYKAAPGAGAFEPMTPSMKDAMNFPKSFSLDSGGNLYVVDQYGSGLALVSRDGSFLGRRLGMGWEEGQLYYPSDVCINDQDTIFIADRNNNRVQIFSVTGKQE